MTVFADISISLDGFVAGPGDEIDPLHDWLYGLESFESMHHREGGGGGADDDVLREAMERAGAIICGRRMYDAAGAGR